jgi:hypothetical protein
MSAEGDARFATLIEALRVRLAEQREERLVGVAEVRLALDSYVAAVEAQLAFEFLSRNGLAAETSAPNVEGAARQILAAVRALPALAATDGATTRVVAAAATESAAEPHAATIPALGDRHEPLPDAVTAPRDAAPTSARSPDAEPTPEPPPTRRRALEPLDDEGLVFREEFEAIDFDNLKDADFLSYANEFAARARLRQEQGLSPSHDLEGRIIRRLTALASTRILPRPVFGLSRSHKGDWAAIARRVRDEREGRSCVVERPSVLTHRLSIPSVLEVAGPGDAPEPVDEERGEIDKPLSLPKLQQAASNADVVMVGGLVKREKLDRVRLRTGIEVEWIGLSAGKSASTVAALAKRIREHRLAALVILNGLMQHKEYEPLIAAARDVSLPVVYADKAGKGTLVKAFVELEERIESAVADAGWANRAE